MLLWLLTLTLAAVMHFKTKKKGVNNGHWQIISLKQIGNSLYISPIDLCWYNTENNFVGNQITQKNQQFS